MINQQNRHHFRIRETDFGVWIECFVIGACAQSLLVATASRRGGGAATHLLQCNTISGRWPGGGDCRGCVARHNRLQWHSMPAVHGDCGGTERQTLLKAARC